MYLPRQMHHVELDREDPWHPLRNVHYIMKRHAQCHVCVADLVNGQVKVHIITC